MIGAWVGAAVFAVFGLGLGAACAQSGSGSGGGGSSAPTSVGIWDGFGVGSTGVTIGLGYRVYNGSGTRPDAFVLTVAPEFQISDDPDVAIGLRFEFQIEEGGLSLRQADFNEVSDYFAMIRYFRYRQDGDAGFHMRAGALFGEESTLGHGTIVWRYNTELDFDHRRFGFIGEYDAKWIGVEMMVNDLTRWNVMAVRPYIRPFSNNDALLLSNMAIGITASADWTAPRQLVDANSDGIPDVDGKGNFVTSKRSLNIVGADVEVPIFKNEILELTPYADFVQIVDNGQGFFLGLFFRAKFSEPLVTLTARVEFRTFSESFYPSYFDELYEIERFQYPELGGAPKLANLDNAATAPAARGLLVSVDGGVQNTVAFAFAYVDYANDFNNELGFALLDVATLDNLNAFLPFRLFARWYKRKVANFNDVFTIDERSNLLVQAIWPIAGTVGLGLNVALTWQRTWRIDGSTGRYEPIDTFYPGIFASMEF